MKKLLSETQESFQLRPTVCPHRSMDSPTMDSPTMDSPTMGCRFMDYWFIDYWGSQGPTGRRGCWSAWLGWSRTFRGIDRFFQGLVSGPLLVVFGLLLAFLSPVCAQPIQDYANYEAASTRMRQLAESPIVRLSSLAKTASGRDVWLLTVGNGQMHEKPAILILGHVHSSHPVGGELAERLVGLIAEGANEEPFKTLLQKYTLYVIPRPSPDNLRGFFSKPYRQLAGNARPTDDDRDGTQGEDPSEDLDADGVITQMRVADPTGPYRLHPDDPRLLIKADRQKGEQGRWALYSEGRDNDGDGRFNEDSGDGVAFNKNFPFQYPFFQDGAGPHQVSEPETQAVADFAFDHPNIAAVFCFTLEDNLFHPWKTDRKAQQQRIKTTLHTDDAPYLNRLAQIYKKLHGGKNAPRSPEGRGSFSEWAYFHYGRWSLAARAWWVPAVPAENKDRQASGDKRASEERNALRWLEQRKIAGFSEWTKIEHPDFPGQTVEVGGFHPFVRLNPPADQLQPLAQKHAQFVAELAKMLPQVKLTKPRVQPLGGGVYEISVTVINDGALPTMSKMGEITRQAYPLQLAIELPKEVTLVKDSPRTTIKPLAGSGGHSRHSWLVRGPQKQQLTVSVSVSAPAVGSDRLNLTLKPGR